MSFVVDDSLHRCSDRNLVQLYGTGDVQPTDALAQCRSSMSDLHLGHF